MKDIVRLRSRRSGLDLRNHPLAPKTDKPKYCPDCKSCKWCDDHQTCAQDREAAAGSQ